MWPYQGEPNRLTTQNTASQTWSHCPSKLRRETNTLQVGVREVFPLGKAMIQPMGVQFEHRRITYPLHAQTAGNWKLLKSIDAIYCTSLRGSDFKPNHVKIMSYLKQYALTSHSLTSWQAIPTFGQVSGATVAIPFPHKAPHRNSSLVPTSPCVLRRHNGPWQRLAQTFALDLWKLQQVKWSLTQQENWRTKIGRKSAVNDEYIGFFRCFVFDLLLFVGFICLKWGSETKRATTKQTLRMVQVQYHF